MEFVFPGCNVSPERHTLRSGILVAGTDVVKLTVYDLLGKEVAVLVNEKKPGGSYAVRFDGTGLSSGVYFYRLASGDFIRTLPMLLLR